MSGIPVKPASRQMIWTLVHKIRRALNVANELYFDIIWFVENIMPQIFTDFTFAVLPNEELGNQHGKAIPDENTIYIREDVYEGACTGNGRDRLTIAHEVGHFLMHGNASIEYCRIAPGEKLPAYRDADWQADVFGGELLAPAYLIEGMTAEQIHECCVVSLQCANAQLRALAREKAKQ